MKFLFTFVFSLFFIGGSFAQKEKDSLTSIWSNDKLQDTLRLNAINNLLADYYQTTKKDNDSAIALAKQMLDLAQKSKNIKYEIEAYTLLGTAYFERKEITTGEKFYTKGLELAQTNKDSFLYADKLYRLGDLYYEYGEYANAFKTLQKSQAYSEKIGDSLSAGWSVATQGFIFRALGDYKEAEKYYLEHLRLSKKYGIKHSIAAANGNLGFIYNDLGDIPKSIKHWKEGIRVAKEIGEPLYAARGTGFFINVYIDEKDYENASKYLDEYISVVGHLDNPEYQARIKLKQCQIDYGLGNYKKALQECNDCIKIYYANGWENDDDVWDILKSLYEINKKLSRHAAALEYFEKYQELIDDKKEKEARTEIQNIIFNNQLAADSIAQIREKEVLNTAFQESLREKNRQKNLYLVIGLLVLIAAMAYFLVSRKFAAKERKRLLEINQLKNALFTNITHEFRTPLTVIKGMTDALKSDLQNKKQENVENSLEMIERNSDNLLHLVNEMLDLSKLESGNMELHLVQSDVIPFLKYLSESFGSFAEENQISLTVYSEIDTLLMDFDGNKLTSIISNLLSNAIKFTPEYGKIIVHINKITQKEKPYLFIKIKDNGIGISNEDLPNIFNRFYQTDASTIRKHEGTGIGLALTKELVALMNGTIKVKSELDKGSEFSVMIPITREAPVTAKVETETIATIPKIVKQSKRIEQTLETNLELPVVLIIEDNEDVAHYLKTCLKGKYQTLHASNGDLGIAKAFENIPDIIISDVMMPGKDGFEVCKTLKADERTDHIPIILLTAKVTTEDRLTGLTHGADAYLAKPFNKKELFIRLDQLVLLRKKLVDKIQKDGLNKFMDKRAEGPETKFLQKAIQFINEDISNSAFGSSDLADKLHLSESQIYRKLKAITDKSTAVFIRSVRLQKAKELIQTTHRTISEIAYETGFNDPSWFSRAFKEEFGYPPSDIHN